jgi:hypothetical protein
MVSFAKRKVKAESWGYHKCIDWVEGGGRGYQIVLDHGFKKSEELLGITRRAWAGGLPSPKRKAARHGFRFFHMCKYRTNSK